MKQAPMPGRRKPLRAGAPLKQGAGLKRKTPMGRKANAAPRGKAPAVRAKPGAMASAAGLVLAGGATVAEAARQFGVDADRLEVRCWTVVKVTVRERDSWTCAECGGMGRDVHHRIRRGAGGTDDPAIDYGTCNLLVLCRRDHNRAHAKDEGMHDRGLWLTTDQDPAEIPVYIRSEWGYERFWLTATGELSRVNPKGLAA